MGDYQPLQTDAESESSTFHRTRSGAPQQRFKLHHTRTMSTPRKFAFISSILICFFTIIIFLWVIPCDWNRCPGKSADFITKPWDRTLFGLELKDGMTVVDNNLVVMLRGSVWGQAIGNQFSSTTGGVISFIGKTGKIAWWTQLQTLPLAIDCSLLDIDSDGFQDCLVLGSHGFLTAISSRSGVVAWRLPVQYDKHVDSIDFPVIIPDVDTDGTRDVAIVYHRLDKEDDIKLISGKTGVVLAQLEKNKSCPLVFNLTLDNQYNFKFVCMNLDGNELSDFSMQIDSVLKKLTNLTVPAHHSGINTIKQHLKIGSLSNTMVGEHKLRFSNTGDCPDDCSVAVNIVDRNNQTVWSYQAHKSLVMAPVVIRFNTSSNGFLLRFWQWKKTEEIHHNQDLLNKSVIVEHVMLVTFNATGFEHVVNASQTEITQLCSRGDCQPQPAFQRQSSMLHDLDGDGSQELISYYVTYTSRSKSPLWELQSKLRVIELEQELALYKPVSL